MEELEGYLQCFDEKDREGVKSDIEYFIRHICSEPDKVHSFLFIRALSLGKLKTVNALIDMGVWKRSDTTGRMYNWSFGVTERLLYDRGIHFRLISPQDTPKLKQFLHSRECARNAAIAVLIAIGRNAKGGFARKDVGRIIGRVIWASRGIKEWTK